MTILDENSLLSEEERQAFQRLINFQGYKSDHFLLEVEEDQESMDMNDIKYVIILKIKVTDLKYHKSKTYLSRSHSGTWLAELEDDLQEGYFERASDANLK
jgi:hypothetical protein